jgi:hypothetical protein
MSPFYLSCVTLSLSSLLGILSTPVLSWMISFRCFQIVHPNSHKAGVRFLVQKPGAIPLSLATEKISLVPLQG